jgi:hypothetical protein
MNNKPYNKTDAAFSIEVFKQIWVLGVLQQSLGVDRWVDVENTLLDFEYATDIILFSEVTHNCVWLGVRAQKDKHWRTHTIRYGRRDESCSNNPSEEDKIFSHVKHGTPGPDLLLQAYRVKQILEFALMKPEDVVEAIEGGYFSFEHSNVDFKAIAWITPEKVLHRQPVLCYRFDFS